MTADYIAYHQHREQRLAQLGKEIPGPTLAPALRSGASAGVTGFSRLHKKAVEAGALDGIDQFLPASS